MFARWILAYDLRETLLCGGRYRVLWLPRFPSMLNSLAPSRTNQRCTKSWIIGEVLLGHQTRCRRLVESLDLQDPRLLILVGEPLSQLTLSTLLSVLVGNFTINTTVSS